MALRQVNGKTFEIRTYIQKTSQFLPINYWEMSPFDIWRKGETIIRWCFKAWTCHTRLLMIDFYSYCELAFKQIEKKWSRHPGRGRKFTSFSNKIDNRELKSIVEMITTKLVIVLPVYWQPEASEELYRQRKNALRRI